MLFVFASNTLKTFSTQSVRFVFFLFHSTMIPRHCDDKEQRISVLFGATEYTIKMFSLVNVVQFSNKTFSHKKINNFFHIIGLIYFFFIYPRNEYSKLFNFSLRYTLNRVCQIFFISLSLWLQCFGFLFLLLLIFKMIFAFVDISVMVAFCYTPPYTADIIRQFVVL